MHSCPGAIWNECTEILSRVSGYELGEIQYLLNKTKEKKMKFDEKLLYDHKNSIHTPKKSQFRQLLEFAAAKGIKWRMGQSPLSQVDYWDEYGEDTVISFWGGNEIGYGSIPVQRDCGQEIVEFEDILLAEPDGASDKKGKVTYEDFIAFLAKREVLDEYTKKLYDRHRETPRQMFEWAENRSRIEDIILASFVFNDNWVKINEQWEEYLAGEEENVDEEEKPEVYKGRLEPFMRVELEGGTNWVVVSDHREPDERYLANFAQSVLSPCNATMYHRDKIVAVYEAPSFWPNSLDEDELGDEIWKRK